MSTRNDQGRTLKVLAQQVEKKWFDDPTPIADSTYRNHQKRLEIMAESHGDIDLARPEDVRTIVAWVQTRYQAPFNVYSTLRKLARALSVTGEAQEIIEALPTGYDDDGDDPRLNKTERRLWLPWKRVVRAARDLYRAGRDAHNAGTFASVPDEDVQDMLLLALYALAEAPRRNEYRNMKVAACPADDNENNYCDLERDVFVFQDYKTRRFYGTQTVPIPPRLKDCVLLHRSRFGFAYVVAADVLSTSAYSNNVRSCMQRRLGKYISSRMLRKMFATDRFADVVKDRLAGRDAVAEQWQELAEQQRQLTAKRRALAKQGQATDAALEAVSGKMGNNPRSLLQSYVKTDDSNDKFIDYLARRVDDLTVPTDSKSRAAASA